MAEFYRFLDRFFCDEGERSDVKIELDIDDTGVPILSGRSFASDVEDSFTCPVSKLSISERRIRVTFLTLPTLMRPSEIQDLNVSIETAAYSAASASVNHCSCGAVIEPDEAASGRAQKLFKRTSTALNVSSPDGAGSPDMIRDFSSSILM